MRNKLSLFFSLLLACVLQAGAKSQKSVSVQPASWWSGMKNPSLQLLVYGDGVGRCQASLTSQGIRVDSIVRPANPNYLIIYVNTAGAAPQKFNVVLSGNGRTTKIPYELRRRDGETKAQGFDASDVLYLLMPDRFVNGDPKNDVVKGLLENSSSQAPDARHGGDLAGMIKALPYLDSMGVTAVWPTPLLVNDMPGTSYHGYAITDYYQIDPRYGSNELYRQFVAEAHRRGMKVVQDMVFNHCGDHNFLFTDKPDSTWFNYRSEYVQTHYKISSVNDPYASAEDKTNAQDGWFVASMPDLNQRNPHVMRYLIQNSIWWIEYAGIDGIRQDTYPYADRRAMAQWCREVMAEYPRFNIVGETWLSTNTGVSYWQKDSPVATADCNSELPTVMDFPLMNLLCSALDEETNDWDKGLARIYEYLCQDRVYANTNNLLTFLDNHDTDRFAPVASRASQRNRYEQALTLLLTLRGIPQLYYGDELAMSANKSRGDGVLRQNFPGGFPGDSVNALTGENLTPLMQKTLSFARRMLNWRKGNDVIAKGSFRHFAIRNGVYVYARQYGGRTVTVLMNGTSQPACVSLAPYAEVLPKSVARDVISGRTIDLSQGTLQLDARGTFVLEF